MSSRREQVCSCHRCGRHLLRKNMYGHLRSVHHCTEEEVQSVMKKVKILANSKRVDSTILCPLCKVPFNDHEELAIHCGAIHGQDGANGKEQDYTLHKLKFISKEEFEAWFDEESERTVSSLYTKSNAGNIVYYRCNRSGKFTSRGADGRRCSTRKGHSHCSCYVNARFEVDGSVAVTACFGHVGHKIEPALLRLSARRKEFLKNLLAEHSLNYVIRRCKRDFPADSRMHFVTKHDLYNIIQRHNIRPVYSSDDGEEFDSFLEDELGGPDAFRASQNRVEEREVIGQKIEQALSEVTAVVNVLINIDTDEALEKLREIHELLDKASKITLVPSSQEPENTVQSEHAGSEVEPISNGALPSILELSRKGDVDNREDKQSRNCEITDAVFFPPRRQRSLRNTSAVIGEADGPDTASLSTSIR